MRVKVRKKPAPAVASGKQANGTTDMSLLTSNISSCCNRRNYGLHKKSITNVYDINSGDKWITAIG